MTSGARFYDADFALAKDASRGFGLQSRAQEFVPSTAAEVRCPANSSLCYHELMQSYIAFLRGINVGGNSIIKMPALKECLATHGFPDARTYIQSGNVIFRSESTNKPALATKISTAIHNAFTMNVAVAVFSQQEWSKIISDAPEWWGKDPTWKHNILIMTESYDTKQAMKEIGDLKPDIELVVPGDGVIYQSISWEHFGRGRSGRIASLPLYKKLTVRNFNTATKLVHLMD